MVGSPEFRFYCLAPFARAHYTLGNPALWVMWMQAANAMR